MFRKKGALILKDKYYSPTISVEVLERADVLLSSGTEGGGSSNTLKREKENYYGDFVDFVIKDVGSWFD